MPRSTQSLVLRLVLAGVLAIGMTGCAAPGAGAARPVTEAGVRGVLTPGASTKADVRASMGEATVTTFPSGYEVWVYQYKAGVPMVVGFIPVVGDIAAAIDAARRERELAILFDKHGIVRKYRLREAASTVERLLAPH